MLIDITQCELPAHAAKLHWRDAALFAAELLLDLRLDGQAMAIPARYVGGAKAGHGFGFHHHILEDLVQGRAEVYGARGIRWSVVQNIGCSASTRLLYTP